MSVISTWFDNVGVKAATDCNDQNKSICSNLAAKAMCFASTSGWDLSSDIEILGDHKTQKMAVL